jgi:hypothetical protein
LATNTRGGNIALPAEISTAWGPVPSSTACSSAWLFGSTERILWSGSLTTSSGPAPLLGDGPATISGVVSTSILPDSELAFRLATAMLCADGSATRTVSELGAAPMKRGARSSWTVVATAAAPTGTTERVWSSTLAVTAYSPASGNGE